MQNSASPVEAAFWSTPVSALHAADVGISVASAVDVAKEAAEIVLLEQDLGVLALLLPFTPLGNLFGFGPVPLAFIVAMGIILALYICAAETARHFFYRAVKS